MNFDLRFHQDNIAKHHVSAKEIEDCFLDSGSLIRRIGKDTYWLLGRTQSGRLLQIGYKTKPNYVAFVFHAMNAKSHEHKQYKRRGK